MARGAASKEKITQKILETFEGAFPYEKEIRVPMMEDGEEIQIKVTLTTAKVNVERGNDSAIPGGVSAAAPTGTKFETPMAPPKKTVPTEAEKQKVAELVKKLGL